MDSTGTDHGYRSGMYSTGQDSIGLKEEEASVNVFENDVIGTVIGDAKNQKILIDVTAQTPQTHDDKSSQINYELLQVPKHSIETQCPIVKRRGMQTSKLSTWETPTQTIQTDRKDIEVQCINDIMINASTLTELPMGVNACVGTDPPCGKHIQTMIVKMKNKKTGQSKSDSSEQTDQGKAEQLDAYVKSMNSDLKYVTGRMQLVLQDVISTYENLTEIEYDDEERSRTDDEVT